MGAMFTMLFSKIAAVITWFSDLFIAIFVAAWDMVTDSFCWVFEQLLKVVTSALSYVDFTAITSYAAGNTVPAEIMNILGLLGIATCISIILVAIGIRLSLQLIPFVRLGS